MHNEDNKFGGSLVLDFRKRWPHTEPKNINKPTRRGGSAGRVQRCAPPPPPT